MFTRIDEREEKQVKKVLMLACTLPVLALLGVQVIASDAPAEAPEPDRPAALEQTLDLEEVEAELFTPAPQLRSCSCTSDEECGSVCLDGGRCMGGECACFTGAPQCGPGGGGGGPGGGGCGECDDNDDCLACGPEYVCASWGECAAV